MQTCPGFFFKSFMEYPGNLLEICSVKSVDTLLYLFCFLNAVWALTSGGFRVVSRSPLRLLITRWSRSINNLRYKTVPFRFCRAMLCISAAYAVMRCLSVCPSVTFVDHVKTNKHIFEIFFTIRWPHHSSFSVPNGVAIFRRNPPHGGVECRWGIGTNRDSGLIAGYQRLLDVRSAKNIYRRRS